jgi:hypothetical protein
MADFCHSICVECGGSGIQEGSPCDCLKKFRTVHWMISGGFLPGNLQVALDSSYKVPPMSLEGEKIINKFLESPEKTEKNGLSLFISSSEKGTGKTTLSHYLTYHWLRYFFESTERYSRNRLVCFKYVSDFVEDFKDCEWKKQLFVLDDLGSENISASWSRDDVVSKLHQMFQYRRNHNLNTLITSNYTVEYLSNRYKGELDSVLEIVDGNIGGGCFKSIKVRGDFGDYRLIDKWDMD